MLNIKRKCAVCGKEREIKVPKEGYERWKAGLYIQEALPTLSDDDREFLMSDICSECFDNLFAEGEL